MFGKLDRYLARNFLEPFLVATAIIVGLYLVADAFSSIEKYLHQAGGIAEALSRMAQVYFLRTPGYLAPVMPIAMLVGAAYGVAQLSGRNEITAMKASGLSFWRILAPIYGMTAILSLVGFANRETVVPRVQQMTTAEEQVWIGKGDQYQKVFEYMEDEATYYCMSYNVAKRQARNVLINRDLAGGRTEHLFAPEAEPTPGGWTLKLPGPDNTRVPYFWQTNLKPRDIEMRLLPPETRPIKVLRRLIRQAERDHNEIQRRTCRLYYHARMAYPFTGIVLVALGVPFVIGSERLQRSRALGIGICLLICMVFYSVQFIASDLGFTGDLPPPLAAWLPHIIFGGLGLYMLESVHG